MDGTRSCPAEPSKLEPGGEPPGGFHVGTAYRKGWAPKEQALFLSNPSALITGSWRGLVISNSEEGG